MTMQNGTQNDQGAKPPTALSCLIAGWTARFLFNNVRIDIANGLVYKSRRRHMNRPISLGNWIVRRRCVPIAFLDEKEWMQWELAVGRLLDREPRLERGQLVMRMIGGDSLGNYLKRRKLSFDQKLAAILQAVRSLAMLHDLTLNHQGTVSWKMSHGDATVWNVAHMPAPSAANWFDYDSRHAMEAHEDLRQADDLRALIFSAAPLFEFDRTEKLIDAILNAYGKESVIAHLREWMKTDNAATDIYHLAQYRGTSALHARLVELMVNNGEQSA